MNTNNIIQLQNVAVTLPVFNMVNRSIRVHAFRAMTGGYLKRKSRDIVVVEALKRVNLEIITGDRIALLGHNGSGKSTLLKVVSGIYEPTSGTIKRSVRVSPLLNLEVGIDHDMTGIEAIRTGCIIRGIATDQLKDIEEDIEEFTELGDYLNFPVRTYSSGMRARLAFAIATSDKPQALAIDEHFSVGDARFVSRAQKRIMDYLTRSSVVVFASHSMPLMAEMCSKGVALRNGEVFFQGSFDDAVLAYNGGCY